MKKPTDFSKWPFNLGENSGSVSPMKRSNVFPELLKKFAEKEQASIVHLAGNLYKVRDDGKLEELSREEREKYEQNQKANALAKHEHFTHGKACDHFGFLRRMIGSPPGISEKLDLFKEREEPRTAIRDGKKVYLSWQEAYLEDVKAGKRRHPGTRFDWEKRKFVEETREEFIQREEEELRRLREAPPIRFTRPEDTPYNGPLVDFCYHASKHYLRGPLRGAMYNGESESLPEIGVGSTYLEQFRTKQCERFPSGYITVELGDICGVSLRGFTMFEASCFWEMYCGQTIKAGRADYPDIVKRYDKVRAVLYRAKAEREEIARRYHRSQSIRKNSGRFSNAFNEPGLFLADGPGWEPVHIFGVARANVSGEPSYSPDRVQDPRAGRQLIRGHQSMRGISFLGDRTKRTINYPLVVRPDQLPWTSTGDLCIVALDWRENVISVYNPVRREAYGEIPEALKDVLGMVGRVYREIAGFNVQDPSEDWT